MRLFTTLLGLLSLALLGRCQSSGITDLAKTIPPCATACVFGALQKSSCGLTDIDCLCYDISFQKASAGCILRQCGNQDMLNMLSSSSEVCNFPIRDRRYKLKAIIISFTSVSSVVVLSRAIYQLSKVGTGFSWDDGFIIVTLALNIASGIIYSGNLVDKTGLGQDVWAIEWDQLLKFVNWFYVVEVIYFGAMMTLKTSILFFFWRIFRQTNLAWPIIGTLIVNALYGVIFLFVGVFQCVPIIFFWKDLDYDRCFDVNAIIWSHAAISIALDIWMLVLPLWRIKTLQMPWKRKIAVGLMFGTGIFVTIMSIVRLKSILDFTQTVNPTWDQYDVALWSTIEINVGIICACMPTLRHIIVGLFPALADTSQQYGYSDGSRNAQRYVRSHTPGQEGGSGHHSKPGLGSKSTEESSGVSLFKSSGLLSQDSAVIVQTRDFVIDSDDEAHLVPMRVMDPKKKEYEIPKAYDLPV